MRKTLLMTPGPTPIPDSVIRAMSDCLIHHRSPAFAEVFKQASAGLPGIFCTRNEVLILCGTGTAAMDATVANYFRSGDRLLVVNGGKFGARWGQIGRAYGLEVDEIDVTWGEAVDPEVVRSQLRQHDYAGLLFQASETSTGAAHPTEALARVAREERPDALVVVDGITAVGSMPVRTDDWGLDIVLSGSQKAFMLPPGLAFLTASERAWARAEGGDLPRYYLDLRKERKAQAKGQTAYTSPTSLILGLVEALRLMHAEGIEGIWARHHKLSEACRAGAVALGLDLLAKDNPSRALTAITCGDGLDSGQIVKALKQQDGIWMAGGQDHLKGRIFRIGHLGWVDDGDVMKTFAALERVLGELGQAFEPGAGVAAAAAALRA